jgi:hypothetical protein
VLCCKVRWRKDKYLAANIVEDLDKLPNQQGLPGTGRTFDQSDSMVEGRDVRKLIILNKGENEIKVAIAISKFPFQYITYCLAE